MRIVENLVFVDLEINLLTSDHWEWKEWVNKNNPLILMLGSANPAIYPPCHFLTTKEDAEKIKDWWENKKRSGF